MRHKRKDNKSFILGKILKSAKNWINSIVSPVGLGLWLVIIIMYVNKYNAFSILISSSYLISIILFYYNHDIIRKENDILMLIFIFQAMIFLGNPLAIAMFVGFIIWDINKYFISKENRIKLESIIIILLTVILLDIGYPILKPRIEIISIDDSKQGYIFDEKPYGSQFFTLSILPPLISPSCVSMILGYDVKIIQNKGYTYGTTITQEHDGKTKFCTPFFDFTKRIVKLDVISQQPLNFKLTNKNLTRFYWISEDNNKTRIHEIGFFNDVEIPIFYAGNFSYIINKQTLLDNDVNLFEFLTNEPKKLDCRLKNFRVSDSREVSSGTLGTYKINNDQIELIMPIFFQLQPHNYSFKYIQFDPYVCDKKV